MKYEATTQWAVRYVVLYSIYKTIRTPITILQHIPLSPCLGLPTSWTSCHLIG